MQLSNEMQKCITKNEKVLWAGKPKKSAYIFSAVIQMLPIALVWLTFDSLVIVMIAKSGMIGGMWFFLVPFFALHLAPVWIWLANIIKAQTCHKNIEYALTNQRLIIKTSTSYIETQSLFYENIESTTCKFSLGDKQFKVGDLFVIDKNKKHYYIYDVEDYENVFALINKLITDEKENASYCEYCGSKIIGDSCVNCGAKVKYTK